jgi:hypothetical protein
VSGLLLGLVRRNALAKRRGRDFDSANSFCDVTPPTMSFVNIASMSIFFSTLSAQNSAAPSRALLFARHRHED